MTIGRRLLIEFGVSAVLGLALCLGVSAYLAGTSSANRVATTTDTSSDPIVHIVAYSGMGFAVARAEPRERDDQLARMGMHVLDRKNAGAGMERAMDLLRDREVTLGGCYGWPVLFAHWTYVPTTPADAGLRGCSYTWGLTRQFELEEPPPPAVTGPSGAALPSRIAASARAKEKLDNIPSFMLPALGHVDYGSLAICASVYVVGCWIALHLLIELVRVILGIGGIGGAAASKNS